MLLKEVCNLLATAWKVAQLKVSNKQISLTIDRGCYSVFTNSRMIKRAQVRCQNMDKEGVPSSSGIDIIDQETESDETPPVKKMLRSTLSSRTSAAAKSRNPHVLPCVCIICKSEKSYFTESVSLLIYFFTIYIVTFLICVL
jgi:hypothetical protein